MTASIEIVRSGTGELREVRRVEFVSDFAALYSQLLPLQDRRTDWGSVRLSLVDGDRLQLIGIPHGLPTTAGAWNLQSTELSDRIVLDLQTIHNEVADRAEALHALALDMEAILKLIPSIAGPAVRTQVSSLIDHINAVGRELDELSDRVRENATEIKAYKAGLRTHILAGVDLDEQSIAEVTADERMSPEERQYYLDREWRTAQEAKQEIADRLGLAQPPQVPPQGGSNLLTPMFGFVRRVLGK